MKYDLKIFLLNFSKKNKFCKREKQNEAKMVVEVDHVIWEKRI